MKKATFKIILFFITITTFGQKSIAGYYSTDPYRMYTLRLQLNNDSTFKYESSGHMSYDKGSGWYTYDKSHHIHLIYDTSLPYEKFRNLVVHGPRPYEFLYKRGKLFVFWDGKIQKRSYAMSKHRKYIFFGEAYMIKKKMYLKKRSGNLVFKYKS